MKRAKRAGAMALWVALTACGATTGNDGQQTGGGTISKIAVSEPSAPASDRADGTVILKLGTAGDLEGRLISGIELALRLPPGVVLDATSGGEIAAGEVYASGVNADPEYVMARYADGIVRIAMINSKGFPRGEFLTLVCRHGSGVAVTADDFTLQEFRAADFTPAVIASAAPSLSLVSQ